jgi:hypothetical protein
MNKRAPLTDADGGVRGLTTNDLAQFRLAAQALPADLHETLGMR